MHDADCCGGVTTEVANAGAPVRSGTVPKDCDCNGREVVLGVYSSNCAGEPRGGALTYSRKT